MSGCVDWCFFAVQVWSDCSILLLLRYQLSFYDKHPYNRRQESVSRAQKSNVTGTPILLTWVCCFITNKFSKSRCNLCYMVWVDQIDTNSPRVCVLHTDNRFKWAIKFFKLLIKLLSKLFLISRNAEELSADGPASHHREGRQSNWEGKDSPLAVFSVRGERSGLWWLTPGHSKWGKHNLKQRHTEETHEMDFGWWRK